MRVVLPVRVIFIVVVRLLWRFVIDHISPVHPHLPIQHTHTAVLYSPAIVTLVDIAHTHIHTHTHTHTHTQFFIYSPAIPRLSTLHTHTHTHTHTHLATTRASFGETLL